MPDSPTTNINPEYTKQGFGATPDQTHIVAMSNGTQGMLDQTLGEILQNNPQAQQMIIQTMGITPEKFEEMLAMAQNNDMMHLTIRQLMENGVVQPAQTSSFLDKVKAWFK